jgi:hypothetical protein
VPFEPHAVGMPMLHFAPLQQPDAQLVASHRQTPPSHRRPGSHAWPEPQRHCPPTQLSLAGFSVQL